MKDRDIPHHALLVIFLAMSCHELLWSVKDNPAWLALLVVGDRTNSSSSPLSCGDQAWPGPIVGP